MTIPTKVLAMVSTKMPTTTIVLHTNMSGKCGSSSLCSKCGGKHVLDGILCWRKQGVYHMEVLLDEGLRAINNLSKSCLWILHASSQVWGTHQDEEPKREV